MSNKMKNAHAIFAERLVNDFCDAITGNNIDELVGISPENKFFVGRLSSVSDAEEERINSSNSIISQIGLDFVLNNQEITDTTFTIEPDGDLFYRVIPNYQQQLEYTISEIKDGQLSKFEDIQEIIADIKLNRPDTKFKIVPVFHKFTLSNIWPDGITIKASDIYDSKTMSGGFDKDSEYDQILDNKLTEVINKLSNSETAYIKSNERLTIYDIETAEKWESFICSTKHDTSEKLKTGLRQNWRLYLSVRIIPIDVNNSRVSITLCNDAKPSYSREGEYNDKQDKERINTLFNASLSVKLTGGHLIPITMPYFYDDYKYDREQYAIGQNCSVSVNMEDNPVAIKTVLLPYYKQYRLVTDNSITAKFNELISNPVESLNFIASKMDNLKSKWEMNFNNIKARLTAKGINQFKEEIYQFENEIKRFKHGINLIKSRNLVQVAFKNMNETFQNSSKGYDSWRLFQIVFIVSLVPDIVACDDEILSQEEKLRTKLEYLDLLYFPTGGGKTEAFLGILVFNLFFDRYRGKKYGTTAILKYPLRLLSIQQVQRVANILASAELIRRKMKNASEQAEFSVGYYVGDNNTPNKITEEVMLNISAMSQEDINEEYRIIDLCPFCHEKSINIHLDKSRQMLVHKCCNKSCDSGGELPLYIVDMDIYRLLPSVIISTLDKFAAVGNNRRFKQILGSISHKCPEHGFMSNKTCEVIGCSCEPQKLLDIYDPTPSLMIQDEMHLVRESLGTFDSHYETFFQYFAKNLSLSRRPIKLIGATATISSYREQSMHLYQKEPIVFPCASPDLKRNFYSYIDESDLHRLTLGFAPFGKAVINGLVYALKYMRLILDNYYKNPEKVLNISGIGLSSVDEAQSVVRDYWIILEYNNVKVDGNNVINALDDPINTELEKEGIKSFDIRKMTGDDTFQDVRKVLAEVENTVDDKLTDGFNMIVATSMISHGVDADRFNNMFFFGIPGNMAEYIQAYSRAGRKYTGIIVDVIRPVRVKDQSYLKNFERMHQYKDILVDPVPINRWASKAIQKTIPGLFCGLILNHYEFIINKSIGKIYMAKDLKTAIRKGLLNPVEIKEHLYKIYCCGGTNEEVALGNQYREFINEFIDNLYDFLQTKDFSNRDYITSALNQFGYPVMNSLRDTDKSLKIELK